MEPNPTKFPYEVFPYEIMLFLEDAHKSLNFPIEYLGSSIISACSVAIGNTYHAKFKEGFIVKSNMYMAIVGKAGDVKTHTLKLAYKPIEKNDNVERIRYNKKLEEYQSLSDEERKTQQKPIFKKSILKDFTPESLTQIHSYNNNGVVILADELFGWIKNFGRYSSSGEQEMYLSLWSGDSISVDRKGDEPLHVENTHVNIIGTIQSKLLQELAKNNRNNNGFLERIIFVLNENSQPLCWNSNELNKEYKSLFETMIKRMISFQNDQNTTIELSFSKEARDCLIQWQNSMRRDYHGDDTATSIIAKYEVYAIKFSMIIQLMHYVMGNSRNDVIELFSVKNAIKLVEYYFDVALRVFEIINNENPLFHMSEDKKDFYKNLNSKFTTQEAVELGSLFLISESTIKRFLKDKELFKRERQGVYSKLY